MGLFIYMNGLKLAQTCTSDFAVKSAETFHQACDCKTQKSIHHWVFMLLTERSPELL